MSENMLEVIEVHGKDYRVNWPFNSDFSDGAQLFDPHFASAILLNAEGQNDLENYTVIGIYPAPGETFTSEADVLNAAPRAVLEKLAIDFLAGNNASSKQYEATVAMVESMTVEEIQGMIP